MQALLSIQPGVVPAETPKALWSDEEEQILSTVPSVSTAVACDETIKAGSHDHLVQQGLMRAWEIDSLVMVHGVVQTPSSEY